MGENKKGCREYFGERLKSLRAEKGISQKVLADELGISKGAVSFYETCQNAPDIEILEAVSKYFGVSYAYLLGRTPNKTTNPELQAVCEYTGLSEKAVENIRSITHSGDNANILLERDEFRSIVTMLNKIKTIAVGQRYYNEIIVPNIESNYLLDSLFDGGEFNNHAKLLSNITYATSQLIECQFSDKTSVGISMIEYPQNWNSVYNEKLVLAEYQFTEHIIRNMINDIKNNTTSDNECFKEFGDQLGDNFDYLLLNLQSNLEYASNHYTGDKLDKRKQELQEDIELLDKFIKFYNEHYRKDGENNG